MAGGEVSPLRGQYRRELRGIERLERAGAQDHRWMPAGDAVGNRLGVLYQHGAEGRLGTADQPRGLRVRQRLPPGSAKVSHGGENGAGGDGSGEREPQPGDGGTAWRAVGLAQPQHARSDQVAKAPFGYRIAADRDHKTLEPDPVHADLVRQAVQMYLAGSSLYQVRDWLYERCTAPQGKAWSAASLSSLFHNPFR